MKNLLFVLFISVLAFSGCAKEEEEEVTEEKAPVTIEQMKLMVVGNGN